MSVHTTSSRQFCRLCNDLLPPGLTLEDHERNKHAPALSTPVRTFPEIDEESKVKRSGGSRKSLSTNYFSCNFCQKKYPTLNTRDRHVTIAHKSKPKSRQVYLHCYECGSKVEKQVYISHLMFHDAERKDMQTSRDGSAGGGNSGKEMDRKFLYLKPDDPRRELADAILQCPECPTYLFFSMRTYTEHKLRCTSYLSKMQRLPVVKTEVI